MDDLNPVLSERGTPSGPTWDLGWTKPPWSHEGHPLPCCSSKALIQVDLSTAKTTSHALRYGNVYVFFSGLFLKPTSTLARGAGWLLFFVSFPPADCHRASGVRRARWDVTSLCGPAFREEPRCHVASTRCQMFRKSGGGVTKHRSLGFWWLPVKGGICIKPLLRLDSPLKKKTRIAFLLSNVFY